MIKGAAGQVQRPEANRLPVVADFNPAGNLRAYGHDLRRLSTPKGTPMQERGMRHIERVFQGGGQAAAEIARKDGLVAGEIRQSVDAWVARVLDAARTP